MVIFAAMVSKIRLFFSRPLAEDFGFRHQLISSLQSGLYVFLLTWLLGGTQFVAGQSAVQMLALFGFGCAVALLLANYILPKLLPKLYDEDHWTVGKHILQTLLILLFISIINQFILWITGNEYPPFWQMYLTVTMVGFFPITVGALLAEQRRLRRNLAQAETLNRQLDTLHQPASTTTPTDLPKSVVLQSETGKERVSLLPNQLLYVESVGNYVEVYWLNFMFPQKTVLRSTLRAVEDTLADQPQFFRCHRAFLVNLRAVSHTTGNARGYQLKLSGSEREVPVSRSFVQAFEGRMAGLSAQT
jgi:LytTr DNA-binding domain